jgi:hypothetical protein
MGRDINHSRQLAEVSQISYQLLVLSLSERSVPEVKYQLPVINFVYCSLFPVPIAEPAKYDVVQAL